MLGAAAGRRLREGFDRAKRERAADFPDGRECVDQATYSPESWRITREGGGWKIEGWSDTHRLCGVGIDYTIQADLSRLTRGQRSAPAARSPNADAIASPDGKWVLVIQDNALMLVSRDALQRPVSRVPLLWDRDSVVMAEWATGANVARWRAQIGRLPAAPERGSGQ